MSHEVEVLLGLFVVFVAAQAGAEVAQRLKMPHVVASRGRLTASLDML